MRRSGLLWALAAGSAGLTYAAYRKDIDDARRRIHVGRQFIDSMYGPIEVADSGSGPALFVIHGAGGGFDQGLHLGRAFAGDGYRIIAPSRFGYLGTPLPSDASAEAQADAHARVLDALALDRVPVIGVSAGGPSAMQLCVRHPDRVSALVLLVPLAYAPEANDAVAGGGARDVGLINAALSSDFIFWMLTKVARSAMVSSILGTPAELYRNATPETRRELDQTLREILPVSERAKGLFNEGVIASNLTRYPLERIHVPTLVVSAEDDGYGTYRGARYTAEETHGEFVGYPTGGHMLVGHQEEVRAKIGSFLASITTPAAVVNA